LGVEVSDMSVPACVFDNGDVATADQMAFVSDRAVRSVNGRNKISRRTAMDIYLERITRRLDGGANGMTRALPNFLFSLVILYL
jgi:hypothetical protein